MAKNLDVGNLVCEKKVTHWYYSLSSWNILAGQLLYINYNLNKLQVSEQKIFLTNQLVYLCLVMCTISC